jgi:hypothetical protein
MSDQSVQDIESYLTAKLLRSDLLGNHYRKNLRNIQDFLPLLLLRMRESGTISLFDFEKVSPFCYEEMELIHQFSHSQEEALDLLGCYYSLQLMTMNLNLLDIMESEMDSFTTRTALYKAMLFQGEVKFARLYSALIRTFVDILSESEMNLPEFVICHVGARRDQDDIDVGIIHRTGGDLVALNRVIGRLNREMYRRATQMHFYLSEHSGSKWFSARIDDYENLMDLDLKNFVIVTQLFGAVPITGSISLFEEFQKRVVMRYTYHEGADNRHYEGFVRGVVEEIRSLVVHNTRTGEIVPKVDGLRLAKMLVTARRATLGIVGGHFWKAFETLRHQDTLLQEEYAFLEEAIAFLETIRFLYQLTFVQEEGILYSDPHCRSALDRVAHLMGYPIKNGVLPSTELMRDYFKYSRRIKGISEIFKEEFKKYVEFIQIFQGLVEFDVLKDPHVLSVNMATDYIEIMERFHQTLPWGEFISYLEEEKAHRRRFFQDLGLLSQDQMRHTLERYLGAMSGDVETLIRFLVCFLKSSWRAEMKEVESEIKAVFSHTVHGPSFQKDSLFRLLLENSSLCLDFIRHIPPDLAVDLLVEIRKIRRNYKASLLDKVLSQSFLYHYVSPILRRKIHRLVKRGLIQEEEVMDTVRLHAVSRKALNGIRSDSGFPARFQSLEDYYDLELIRFAFRSIRTGRFPRADYMDSYVRRLTRLSLEERGLGHLVRDPKAFSLYATGGNARGEAFENDYDMFVLVDPSRIDPEPLHHALQRIHRELARLGTIPHHRMGEQIGGFVFSLEALENYLDQGNPEDFIERTELMGSRLIIGGTELHRLFQESIVRQRLFGKKMELIDALKQEFKDLHPPASEFSSLDLKQRRGGLFDITMLVSMLKAFFEIYEPRDLSSLRLLRQKDPSHSVEYEALFKARAYLTEVRGILKLTGYSTRIDDNIEIRYPALIKGFPEPAQFVKKIETHMDRVCEASEHLMQDLL